MDFKHILHFLQKLSRHNDREWFAKNKNTYLEAKDHFEKFVGAVLKEFIKFDEGLAALDPKRLPLRIYRDVRFSKDKSPYKKNMSAGFSPGGKLMQEPGYYLHVQPGNKSFLAGGMYVPDPANLAKIRQEIDYSAERFLKILNSKRFKTLFPALDDFDKLKTSPKGYAKDHPLVDLLKHKSFVVSHYFTDKEVLDGKFVKQVAQTAREIKPLNDFLKEAIS